MKKIFVGNFSFQTTDGELRSLFEPHGAVDSVTIVTDRDTGRSRGFAFVEMDNADEALRAISLCHGNSLHDRALVVNEARAREDRPSGSGFNRGSKNTSRLKFREVKHKARGGRKARSY